MAARTLPLSNWKNDRVFYTVMSLAFMAAVFIGFARTYYLKGYYQAPSLTLLVHTHGLVFTSWILLFITQTALIAKKRVALHRRLGVLGAVLAGLLVILGVTTAIVAARRNFAAGDQGALGFLAFPFGDMLAFAILVTMGIYYRRQTETHKRLLLLATIAILDAAFSRWPLAMMSAGPLAWFGLTDLLILAGIVYDLISRRRVHPVYLWGGLLLIASQFLRLALAGTSVWRAFARLLVQ